jgi:hypothetical protein
VVQLNKCCGAPTWGAPLFGRTLALKTMRAFLRAAPPSQAVSMPLFLGDERPRGGNIASRQAFSGKGTVNFFQSLEKCRRDFSNAWKQL